MPLFQQSVLKKYLRGLNASEIDNAYKIFTEHFHNPGIQENIRNSKEEQYQGEFLIDLFVNVLGYVKNPTPDFNLTTELKNIKGSKKSDGAILKGEKALAVIELKGTNTTDLNKVETQAFGYKNNQPGCKYVITSNFEKLRFYIEDAVDFEEFNLFNLSKDKFELLWLCLSFEYLLKDIPKKIKEESLTQEEDITKKLYKDYSLFRNEIFISIQKENPQYDKLTLFKKTQKLLDRFLFIFFAEDRLLLPPNSIRSIVNQWTDLRDKYDAYTPLYDRFKKYFGYMNTGHKGDQHSIFAYNGGLFAPDEILDNIKINDDLLYKHTVNLSNYDFESEVSVNILGHIFEHSLNDIDEIQAEIKGVPSDQSNTKRKKDGIFYTPKYITKYIVDNTIGRLCEEKKIEFGIQEEDYEKVRKGRQKATLKKLKQKLENYRNWLLQITICDPACGSGAFLNQSLEFLIAEHLYIDELQSKLFGDAMTLSEVENSILEKNLFGVDINEESVEIAKLSLWLRTARKGRKLNSLSSNIKCGNSLINMPVDGITNYFNWEKEFPKIFEKGGFDVMIGNPPYVQNNEEKYNTYFTFECGDLYSYFFERGLQLLNKKGIFSYITPNLFIKGMRYEKLRKHLLEHSRIIEILDKGDKIFEGVQIPTAITTLSKEKKNIQKWDDFLPNNNIIERITDNTSPLKNITKIQRGLELGKDKVLDYKSDIQFLVGENIFRYGIKEFSYIDNTTYNKFKKDNYYFTGDRILIRETGNRITSIFLNDNITQQNRSIYSIKTERSEINPLFILSILNSKTIQFFYQSKFASNTNIFPKIRIGQVKELPIKIISQTNQIPFIQKTKIIISGIENLIELSKKFQRTIQRKFEIHKLPKKLQNWYLLTYGEFIKELGKMKIKLSLSEESEWEDFFVLESKKVLDIKDSIERTDKEIDQMVYELYGLTNEEIEIVENS